MYNGSNYNYSGNNFVDNQENNSTGKSSINKILIILLLLIIIGLVYLLFFKNSNDDKVNNVKLNSISFPKDSLSLKVGSSFDLSNHLILDPSNATVKNIKYNNGNSSILNISNKGIIQALASGNDEITIIVNGDIEKKISVTVSDNGLDNFVDKITSLRFATSYIEIAVGEEKDLEILPLNVNKSSLSWQSSNVNIVTVDSNGRIKGVSSGNATVLASLNGIEARIDIQVSNNATNQSIEFDQLEITNDANGRAQLKIKKGEKYTLIPKIVPDTLAGSKLDFTVSEKDFVTLVTSADGKSVVINATGKVGTVVLTVRSSNNISRDLILIIEENNKNSNDRTSRGKEDRTSGSGSRETDNKVDNPSDKKADDDYIPPMTGSCDAKLECSYPTYTGQALPTSSIASCEHCSIISVEPRDKTGSPTADTYYTIKAVSLGVCRFKNGNTMATEKTITCPILKKK